MAQRKVALACSVCGSGTIRSPQIPTEPNAWSSISFASIAASILCTKKLVNHKRKGIKF